MEQLKEQNSIKPIVVPVTEDMKAKGVKGEILMIEKMIQSISHELGHLKNAKVVRYLAPFHWSQFLRRLGKAEIGSLHVKIPNGGIALQTGRLYYLSPHLFSRE